VVEGWKQHLRPNRACISQSSVRVVEGLKQQTQEGTSMDTAVGQWARHLRPGVVKWAEEWWQQVWGAMHVCLMAGELAKHLSLGVANEGEEWECQARGVVHVCLAGEVAWHLIQDIVEKGAGRNQT